MRVTSEYIAQIAHVSKATVSRVANNNPKGVSEEVRARVQKVIDEYGYSPDFNLLTNPRCCTKTIGLIIPDIMNPFFPELVLSVEQRLEEYGYIVILCNTGSSAEREKQIITNLLALQVDGVILATGLTKKDCRIDKRIRTARIPIVLADRKTDGVVSDVGIFVDNEYAFFQATDFLCSHGSRSILFLKGTADMSTTEERFAGYCNALRQNGIDYDASLVYQGDYNFQSGYDGVCETLKNDVSFNAVLASNDMMAFGALHALRERGISVPEQVEVIGCDNITFCDMTEPPLTTIRQPLAEMGRCAADTIIQLIEGTQPKERSIRIQAELLLRESTRK